jgi:signal transduction histidine kinase
VFEPEGDDEISRLALTMNRMLERLEESAESSRRFVADASHELKSPISALQTSLEVSLLRPKEADWPRVALDGLTEAHRMQTLVEDLLILAKADAGRLKLKFEPVDLDELVIEEARRARSRTESKIRLSSVSGGRGVGVGVMLRSVVRNLMENAIRHCESTVSVALRQEGSSVVFEVLDDGPGVPEADRETIFRRFVRLDESRSRGDGGSGLGLAITKSIVEAHSGRIWVEGNNQTGKGARFVVVLPASDPSFTSQPLEITP